MKYDKQFLLETVQFTKDEVIELHKWNAHNDDLISDKLEILDKTLEAIKNKIR